MKKNGPWLVIIYGDILEVKTFNGRCFLGTKYSYLLVTLSGFSLRTEHFTADMVLFASE